MKFWSKLKTYLTRPRKLTAYKRILAQAEERGKVLNRAEALHQKIAAFARQAVDLNLNDVAQVFIDMMGELADARKAVIPELAAFISAAREDRPAQADKTAEKVAVLQSCIESVEARLKTIPHPGKFRRTNAVEDGRLVRANFRPKP